MICTINKTFSITFVTPEINCLNHAFSIVLVQDLINLNRKAFGGDFLVDKFQPFIEADYLYWLLLKQYELFVKDSDGYLAKGTVLPVMNSQNNPNFNNFFTLIDYMKDDNYTGIKNLLGTTPSENFINNISTPFTQVINTFTNELMAIQYTSNISTSMRDLLNSIKNGISLIRDSLMNLDTVADITNDIVTIINEQRTDQTLFGYFDTALIKTAQDLQQVQLSVDDVSTQINSLRDEFYQFRDESRAVTGLILRKLSRI